MRSIKITEGPFKGRLIPCENPFLKDGKGEVEIQAVIDGTRAFLAPSVYEVVDNSTLVENANPDRLENMNE